MNTIKSKILLLGIEVTTRFNWWYWVATTYVPPSLHYWFG